MCIKFVYFILFISSVCCRHMPRYADLDDEDQHLLRAAYDTPSYDHDEYQEDNDMPLGKLDLLKDGLWAVKAKIKELKAFNKALAANFLSTKLKVKELIAASLVLKKHSHGEVEKKKPAYNYQLLWSETVNQLQVSTITDLASFANIWNTTRHRPPLVPTPDGGLPIARRPRKTPSYQPQYAETQYAPQYAESQYAQPQHQHDPYYGQ